MPRPSQGRLGPLPGSRTTAIRTIVGGHARIPPCRCYGCSSASSCLARGDRTLVGGSQLELSTVSTTRAGKRRRSAVKNRARENDHGNSHGNGSKNKPTVWAYGFER